MPLDLSKVATSSYFDRMRKVGIKLLKNKLSEYLRMVADGEVILVTDRDEVVAELRAPSPVTRSAIQDEKLAELVRRGLITPATRPPGPIPSLPPNAPRMTEAEFQAMLDEMREDRWPPT